MANRGDNKLRLLLTRFELKTPSQEFTGEVMKEIQALANDNVFADEGLKAILKRNVSSGPPASFTYKVLKKVRGLPASADSPIITGKVWGLISAFITICLIVAVVSERAGNPSTDQSFYFSVADYVSTFTIRFIEPLFYLGVIFLSAILLLAIDYFFRRKLRVGNPND